jgi:5-methylcytosine-specific restriction enzyme A
MATPGSSMCDVHQAKYRKVKDAQQQGNSAMLPSGSTPRWRRIRALQLAKEPLCRLCQAEGRVVIAVTVDHIVPRSQGGTDEELNLQSLCLPHRRAKDAKDRAARSF